MLLLSRLNPNISAAMKTILLLAVIAICPALAAAQDQVLIQIENRAAPTEYEACFHPQALEISSSYTILNYEYDSIHDILYLSTEGKKKGFMKGWLTAISLKEKTVLWSIPMNTPSDRLLLVDSCLLITDKSNTRAVDRETGENRWSKPIRILSVLPDNKKLLASSTMAGTDLDLVDIQSGKIEWQFIPKFPIDTESILMAGDTAIAVLGKGVHYVSLKDGLGWSKAVKMKSTAYRQSTTGGAVAASIAAGLIGAMFGFIVIAVPISYSARKKVGSDQTNIALEYGAVYLATGKEIMRFDHHGMRVWINSGFTGNVGIPTVILEGDDLYIVHKGVEYVPNGTQLNSIPSILRVDKHTEEILASTAYKAGKNEYILDFMIVDNKLLVIGNNRMLELNPETLEPTVNKVYGSSHSSFGLKRIVSSTGFVNRGDNFEFLSNSNYESILFENTAGGKILFNRQMEIIEAIPKSKYFDIEIDFGDKLPVSNSTSSCIITREGETLVSTSRNPGSRFIGRSFYIHEGLKLNMMLLK